MLILKAFFALCYKSILLQGQNNLLTKKYKFSFYGANHLLLDLNVVVSSNIFLNKSFPVQSKNLRK